MTHQNNRGLSKLNIQQTFSYQCHVILTFFSHNLCMIIVLLVPVSPSPNCFSILVDLCCECPRVRDVRHQLQFFRLKINQFQLIQNAICVAHAWTSTTLRCPARVGFVQRASLLQESVINFLTPATVFDDQFFTDF